MVELFETGRIEAHVGTMRISARWLVEAPVSSEATEWLPETIRVRG